MRNPLCEKLGIAIPILQAPMGGAVGPEMAAAVSNAGGLGILPLSWCDVDTVRKEIRRTKSLTAKPFSVNLCLELPQEERLQACLAEGVSLISLFWGNPETLTPIAKSAGATVLQTVGSAKEAQAAVECGADIIVAQGWEAGGHVWGKVATMALVPAVVDAVGPVPVVAAGGIADGRGLAAVLALGASGAWISTRLLASTEADIHPHYRERLLRACEADTYHSQSLFDVGWPDAPHRVLRNTTVDDWEQQGQPPTGKRSGEGDVVAVSSTMGNIMRYSSETPTADMSGDIEALAMWAGQGVGLVRKLQPAAEIVDEIYRDALAILQKLGRDAAVR